MERPGCTWVAGGYVVTRGWGLGLWALALAACTVPGVGYLGTGPLPLHALAISATDPETGNAVYQTVLRWPSLPGARQFEVLRKFGDNPANIRATVTGGAFDDYTVAEGQSFSYTVHVLGGEGRSLGNSELKQLTLPKRELDKPKLISPAQNAILGVGGEAPALSWEAQPKALWYYVRVTRADNAATVYAAWTTKTAVKYGEATNLKMERFYDLFPSETGSSLGRGVLHEWRVTAVRPVGSEDLNAVTTVEMRASDAWRFSQ